MIDPFDLIIVDGLGALFEGVGVVVVGVAEIAFDTVACLGLAIGLEDAGRALASQFRKSGRMPKERQRILTIFGLFLVGCFVGYVTLQSFPALLIPNSSWRLLNFVAVPIIVGLVFRAAGITAKKRSSVRGKLFTFIHGYALAFGIVLVRLVWAT